MQRYRIYSEPFGAYNGCFPITVHWVQVRKETFWGTKWQNVKGFEDKNKAIELLNILK